MEHLLKATTMLDYPDPAIQALVDQRGWRMLDSFHQASDEQECPKDSPQALSRSPRYLDSATPTTV